MNSLASYRYTDLHEQVLQYIVGGLDTVQGRC
jgi:hypothetical protein